MYSSVPKHNILPTSNVFINAIKQMELLSEPLKLGTYNTIKTYKITITTNDKININQHILYDNTLKNYILHSNNGIMPLDNIDNTESLAPCNTISNISFCIVGIGISNIKLGGIWNNCKFIAGTQLITELVYSGADSDIDGCKTFDLYELPLCKNTEYILDINVNGETYIYFDCIVFENPIVNSDINIFNSYYIKKINTCSYLYKCEPVLRTQIDIGYVQYPISNIIIKTIGPINSVIINSTIELRYDTNEKIWFIPYDGEKQSYYNCVKAQNLLSIACFEKTDNINCIGNTEHLTQRGMSAEIGIIYVCIMGINYLRFMNEFMGKAF